MDQKLEELSTDELLIHVQNHVHNDLVELSRLVQDVRRVARQSHEGIGLILGFLRPDFVTVYPDRIEIRIPIEKDDVPPGPTVHPVCPGCGERHPE
jgi:hypothetical protein